MANIDIFGTPCIVGRTAPWSKKGWTIKRKNVTSSVAQIKARVALGEAAYSAYKGGPKGSMGLVNGIPAIAAHVQATVPKGEGAHGGKKYTTRAAEKHAAARGSLDALKARIR